MKPGRRITIVEIDRLAPPAPACFEARDIWLQYLDSAMDHRPGERGARPVVKDAWNRRFSPCVDCEAGHEDRMRQQDRCERDAFTWLAEEHTAC